LYVDYTYPIELEIKGNIDTTSSTYYLDLYLVTDSEGRSRVIHFDRRNKFPL